MARPSLSAKSIRILGLLSFLSLAGVSSVSASILSDSLISFTSSDLPIVIINTHGQDIPDEPKIAAEMGIIDNGPGMRNSITDPYNAYDGNIGIELRGSSSTMFPKKQFAVETRDSAGNGVNVSLLGMPSQSDWVFSAPYTDKSLMRDPLLYSLARSMGRYASRCRYFELVLNSQYSGVYVLLEKIKKDKNRVNITKMASTDTTGDAVTGGYIVKIDKIEGADTQGWYSGLPPYPAAWQKVYYQFHYPKPEDLVWSQRAYITQFIRDFEIAMYLPTFADSVKGYPHVLDVDSFVDFLLLNELSKNVDAYRLSTFMYKDRDSKGGKLVMGPVWDFNLAFGNCDYYRTSNVEGFHLTFLSDSLAFRGVDSYPAPFWWKTLFHDPSFHSKLAQRWTALRVNQFSIPRITAIVDSLAAILDESQKRNFIRWSVLGRYIWPNAYVGQTYQDEIDYMKHWIGGRIEWLDSQFSTSSVDAEGRSNTLPFECSLSQNYPNPFNPTTVVSYQLPVVSHVTLSIYDIIGRDVATLVNEVKEPGKYSVQWEATDVASGVYFLRMNAGTFVSTKKMILLR
jgi:hypothetical protein